MSGYSVTEVTRAFTKTLERFPQSGAILGYLFNELHAQGTEPSPPSPISGDKYD